MSEVSRAAVAAMVQDVMLQSERQLQSFLDNMKCKTLLPVGSRVRIRVGDRSCPILIPVPFPPAGEFDCIRGRLSTRVTLPGLTRGRTGLLDDEFVLDSQRASSGAEQALQLYTVSDVTSAFATCAAPMRGDERRDSPWPEDQRRDSPWLEQQGYPLDPAAPRAEEDSFQGLRLRASPSNGGEGSLQADGATFDQSAGARQDADVSASAESQAVVPEDFFARFQDTLLKVVFDPSAPEVVDLDQAIASGEEL